ncbi:SDR family oxidoreductase [Streptomyces sp. NPDC093252]|uniref:SDR family oxidoreductase n=1 Tax=Streptomyces sp. NPDC093252 TaxID=3154980 RepID=UPI00344500A8
MRVLVTGATGFIGSAVVPELLAAGHTVVGLARSERAAETVTAAGAEPYAGHLEDLDGLRRAADAVDGVVHTAFIHDFATYTTSVQIDRRAIEAMGDALAGSGRPLVAASGTAGPALGRVVTEDDIAVPTTPGALRAPSEQSALALAERGVRASVVRLPPAVHGRGDHGLVPVLIDLAVRKGVAAYLDDGANRWPAVHRLDAARLFRLALEKAPAGARLHGVAEEGVPFRVLAQALGGGLGLPTASVAHAAAHDHFGWLGVLAGMDAPASSARTRALLDWHPERPGLLADLGEGHYFADPVPSGAGGA